MLLYPSCLFVILPISSLSHISTIVFCCTLSWCADSLLWPRFPDASSCESAVALIQWWARSHIWKPLAGKSPAQPPPSPPPALLNWLDQDFFRRLLRLLKQQNRYRTKTLRRRSVFHLGAEQRLHMLMPQGSLALKHSIYQLSIHQRLI